MILKFKKLKTKAYLPKYAHENDAAFDVFSIEKATIKPGERHKFLLGLASQIPPQFLVKLHAKSGLADKYGIQILGGIIDEGYRGEWGVILLNSGQENFRVEIGDKIAQGILEQKVKTKIKEVNNLDDSERGTGGFGSTGK